ncbi:hypothetical protein [Haloplasma contractile]|uniref:Membrane lipoprotein n=1 Tax=Haloplasma contractile SSD-17B TaxID=1033810 RepID=F7PTU6_9MOLU|nr:hypothetical protein [Haloplasma contractile]ERJ12263.1 membrane lipoprotein [Haloplasma contractile SSD-17B]
MFKKGFLLLAMLGVMLTLAACSSEEEAKITDSYVYSETAPYEYQGAEIGSTVESYRLNLYDDGTYNMVRTGVTVISGSNAGTTVWESFGTYEKGDKVDGFTSLTLSDANRAIYTSYSTMGGFSFNYDSEKVEDWSIVELGGGIEVEDKADFLSNVEGKTVFIVLNSANDETAQLSFEGLE